ncbi:hypothetical protein CALVIDRAFT_539701 [Calocera viscosa TUFC12733]|uniref:Pre-rRNA-processing protein TSR2 n=1 Tax=Calocera viscosa (strain TUFC12733) TaxID=1330018 RepID=A0A167JPS8_CALVF|nr:hypothetical protein CALVIDRAFT_539701 [Calocera viscosa TUFC12733]
MASTSASTSAGPTPAQLTLFARSVLAHLRLWPALRLSLQNSEIPSNSQNVQLFASEIIDQFTASKGAGPAEEDVEDLLLQIMDEEFETIVDDDSVEGIARGLLTTWRGLADPSAEASIRLLEEQADKAGKTRLQVQQREEIEEASDEEEGEGEDVEMTGEAEAPQLLERPERQEPVVDDDGFTLVQKKGRR